MALDQSTTRKHSSIRHLNTETLGILRDVTWKALSIPQEKIEAAEIKHMEGEAMRKCWEKLNEEEFDKITGGSGNRRCYKDQLDICMLQKTKKKIEDDATERALLERINRIRKELDVGNSVFTNNTPIRYFIIYYLSIPVTQYH